jgi:hypothetical protein
MLLLAMVISTDWYIFGCCEWRGIVDTVFISTLSEARNQHIRKYMNPVPSAEYLVKHVVRGAKTPSAVADYIPCQPRATVSFNLFPSAWLS